MTLLTIRDYPWERTVSFKRKNLKQMLVDSTHTYIYFYHALCCGDTSWFERGLAMITCTHVISNAAMYTQPNFEMTRRKVIF